MITSQTAKRATYPNRRRLVMVAQAFGVGTVLLTASLLPLFGMTGGFFHAANGYLLGALLAGVGFIATPLVEARILSRAGYRRTIRTTLLSTLGAIVLFQLPLHRLNNHVMFILAIQLVLAPALTFVLLDEPSASRSAA